MQDGSIAAHAGETAAETTQQPDQGDTPVTLPLSLVQGLLAAAQNYLVAMRLLGATGVMPDSVGEVVAAAHEALGLSDEPEAAST